ncbi:MAG: energy-coupling factor ABC transporter ATP-binding protein [Propionibacteriaceae bacterium]|nr:energy-coupling factor ABC transporter ATP-binding protein [Propionibacteriaceae bacterium]
MIELVGVSVAVSLPQAGRPAASRTLLADVNLSLAEQRVAVVGANGSGKSTLLRLLNGLILASAGQVLVGGLDTAKQGRQVRAKVGFIFTDPLAQLLMGTALDDVELSLRSAVADKKLRRERALQLLAERGLERFAEQSVYDLSGGERQLVALTSVLATGPQIVVADEPTTLLDLRNRNTVVQALWALPQQVIVATHDLDLAAAADRVVVIHEGRVHFDGEPAAAIGRYKQVMGA